MAERPVVARAKGGFSVHLRKEERQLVSRLLGELAGLLSDPDADPALVARLFPVVHPDDPAMEAEYQRLMRQELVTSRLSAITAVQTVLDRSGRSIAITEEELLAFMQSVNAVRLVLGTLLGVDDDDEDALGFAFDDDEEDEDDSAEHHLYGYLSWLLDVMVVAQRD